MLRFIKHAFYFTVMVMFTTQASGCNSTGDKIVSVSASEFNEEIKTDSVQLLDVRTPQEYADGHIDGALNIDVHADDFRQMAEKELSKSSTILVYCRSGRRSLDAADILTQLGYKVINLKGGIIEWKDNGLPTTTIESAR